MIENRGHYITYLASDWEEAADGQPPFLVAGIISSAVTLVYGRSEAGKSMTVQSLLAALARGDSHWLGREVQQAQWRTGVLTGDYGDGVRYSERLTRVIGPEAMSRIRIFDTSGNMPFDGWPELLKDMDREERQLLVVDNLSAFVPGDINNGPPCENFFNCLSHFVGAGIAVVVVAHSTEKYSKDGVQDFIGHSSIRQRPTAHVRITKTSDGKTIWCHGNHGGELEITLAQPDPAVPAFEVTGESEGRKRKRSPERTDRSDQYREHVLATCQDISLRSAAKSLANAFPEGPAEATHRNRLSDGSYGIKLSDGQWMPQPRLSSAA